MALDGLRWSRDSGSANGDMPRSAVFGRSGGEVKWLLFLLITLGDPVVPQNNSKSFDNLNEIKHEDQVPSWASDPWLKKEVPEE